MSLAARLADVDGRILDAARAAGRDPGQITRIVVTKFHPPDLIRRLAALGVQDVGENRQQELTAKRDALDDVQPLTWHFIGQAQTNKARAIRAAADVVHSVDRAKLVSALDGVVAEEGPPLDVLIQVNLTSDPGRGGVDGANVEELATRVAEARSLRLRGIMAVAPLDVPAASAFDAIPGLSERVRRVVPDATWISAGMTADFPAAIAAGATHLRIGSAITGPRPVHG